MKQTIIILLFSILLIGCSTQTEIECQNITIETIKYINKTIKEPCNVTYIEDGCQYKKSYVLDLIRRINFLEKHQDELIIDEIECNQTVYKGKLDMCERDLEEVEDELEDCEDEVCEYNSSWC